MIMKLFLVILVLLAYYASKVTRSNSTLIQFDVQSDSRIVNSNTSKLESRKSSHAIGKDNIENNQTNIRCKCSVQGGCIPKGCKSRKSKSRSIAGYKSRKSTSRHHAG